MSVKKTCFVLLVLLLGVLFTGTYGYAAIASSLSIGEGYVNYGRAKDVYSLPDKDSDIIAALAVGVPCDILSISGHWFMHKEVRQLGDPCMSILYPLYERRKARSIAGALLHDLFNFLSSPVPFRMQG